MPHGLSIAQRTQILPSDALKLSTGQNGASPYTQGAGDTTLNVVIRASLSPRRSNQGTLSYSVPASCMFSEKRRTKNINRAARMETARTARMCTSLYSGVQRTERAEGLAHSWPISCDLTGPVGRFGDACMHTDGAIDAKTLHGVSLS